MATHEASGMAACACAMLACVLGLLACKSDKLDPCAAAHCGQGGTSQAATASGGSGGGFSAPTWTVDLVGWVQGLVGQFPSKNSDSFVAPTAAQRAAFDKAADALLTEQVAVADSEAAAAGYQVVQLSDSGGAGEMLYALVPAPWTEQAQPGPSGGLFVVRPQAEVLRQMAVAAPHPGHDTYSGELAARVMRLLKPRALFVAGANRCTNTSGSACSGTTTACGSPAQPYRNSDMAHVVATFFQLFHQRVDSEAQGKLTQLQVHGMSSAASSPEFSISDGSSKDADAQHTPNVLAEHLVKLTKAAGSTKPGNSCNRAGDLNLLCGSTNTQGRFSNGVAAESACVTSASIATGRFVHAELSKAIRDSSGALGPQVFIDALKLTFP